MAVNPTRLFGMTELPPSFSFRPIGLLRGAAARNLGDFGRMEP